MRVVLRNRQFMWFWVGQTVSRLGDACFGLTLAWMIMDLTNSAVVLGSVMLAMAIPETALSLFGGGLVDRLDLRKLMAATETLAGILTGSLWVLHFSGHLQLWHIYVFAVAFGTVEAVYSPIYLSAMPRLVDDEGLPAANMLFSSAEQLVFVLGPAVGGFLIHSWGAPTVIALDAVTFFFSAACALAIKGPLHNDEASDEPIWQSIGSLFKYLRKKPIVWSLLAIRGLGNVGIAPFEVLLVVWVRQSIHAGPEVLGLINTVLSLGTLAGCFLGFPLRTWTSGKKVLAANLVLGLLLVLFPAITWLPLAGVNIFFIGYLLGAEQVLVDLLYQRVVDQGWLGRVASARVLVSQSLRPFAQGLSGWVAALAGVGPAVIAGGCVLSLTAVATGKFTQLGSAE